MPVEFPPSPRPGFAFNVCAALSFLHLLDNSAMADSRPSSPPSIEATILGRPEVVYDWKSHECSRFTYPDTAARAFRDANGQVRLLAPNDLNWSMAGPSLDRLRPDCETLARGDENPDPGKFDDKPWIEATYTLDGRTVFALASNEWNANRHPSNDAAAINCRDPHNQACYFYGITAFISRDGGQSFAYPAAGHLVAALPFRFHPAAGRGGSTGIATVSNIIARGGAYYAFVGVRGVAPQQSGSCLIRTENLADPAAWRAWDGHGFNVRFANPYTDDVRDPARQVCVPVYPYEVRSINWLPAQKTYIGVFREWGNDDRGKRAPGFFYATTPDLIAWSGMRLIMKIPTEEECGEVDVYPSLLDPTSEGRNFETLGSRPYLYYVRFNRTRCGGTLDRDLVRIALKIGNAAAPTAPAEKRP